MLNLIKSVQSNAKQKGLDVNSLVINSIVPKQGPKVVHYGRKRSRTAKRTHIEIVVRQAATKSASPVKTAKKETAPTNKIAKQKETVPTNKIAKQKETKEVDKK